MSSREHAAVCMTCGSAPGEPCREVGARRDGMRAHSPLLPSQRPVVGTHLARLHRVLLLEWKAKMSPSDGVGVLMATAGRL